VSQYLQRLDVFAQFLDILITGCLLELQADNTRQISRLALRCRVQRNTPQQASRGEVGRGYQSCRRHNLKTPREIGIFCWQKHEHDIDSQLSHMCMSSCGYTDTSVTLLAS